MKRRVGRVRSRYDAVHGSVLVAVQLLGGATVFAVVQAAVTTLVNQMPALFVFSLIWTAGASTTLDGRRVFDLFLRQHMADKAHPFPFPAAGTVYDYQFDKKEVRLVNYPPLHHPSIRRDTRTHIHAHAFRHTHSHTFTHVALGWI